MLFKCVVLRCVIFRVLDVNLYIFKILTRAFYFDSRVLSVVYVVVW